MRQASQDSRGRLCPLLYRPVPVHLLLGTEGAGDCRRTWHSIQGNPYYRQRICAECPRAGHDLRSVPGRTVPDTEYSVRQKVSGAGRRSRLSRRRSEEEICGGIYEKQRTGRDRPSNDITKNYREIIENVNEAIDWAVKKELWVIYIQHNNLSAGTRTFRPGTRGAELVPELNVVSDHIFTKSKSNALTSEAFSAFLQERGITEVYEAPRLTPQKLVNSVLCFRFQYDSCAW